MSNNNLRQKYHRHVYTQQTVDADILMVAEEDVTCPAGHTGCEQMEGRYGVFDVINSSGPFYTNFSTLRNMRAMNHIHTYNQPEVSLYLVARHGMDAGICPSGHAYCRRGLNERHYCQFEDFFYHTENSFDNEVAQMRQQTHEHYIRSLCEIDDAEYCWVTNGNCPLGHSSCQGYEAMALQMAMNGVNVDVSSVR